MRANCFKIHFLIGQSNDEPHSAKHSIWHIVKAVLSLRWLYSSHFSSQFDLHSALHWPLHVFMHLICNINIIFNQQLHMQMITSIFFFAFSQAFSTILVMFGPLFGVTNELLLHSASAISLPFTFNEQFFWHSWKQSLPP